MQLDSQVGRLQNGVCFPTVMFPFPLLTISSKILGRGRAALPSLAPLTFPLGQDVRWPRAASVGLCLGGFAKLYQMLPGVKEEI